MVILVAGSGETEVKAQYTAILEADPTATCYQDDDGNWIIEGSAVKVNIPGVRVYDEKLQSTILTPEEHVAWKAEKIAAMKLDAKEVKE
jgi:hypothetical protein